MSCAKQRIFARALVSCFMVVLPLEAFASSGADVLLRSVIRAPTDLAAPPASAAPASDLMTAMDGVKLDDPFKMQFFSAWQTTQGQQSYEVNSWVLRILRGQVADAAHLWGVIEPKVAPAFANAARAGWLYSLWKLDLSLGFLAEWLDAMSDGDFAASLPALALDQTISPRFADWLRIQAVSLSSRQLEQVSRISPDRGPHYLSLHAWSALRRGSQGAGLLPRIPVDHPLKVVLAQTAAFELARKGDLAGAGKILKAELEPAIEATRDPLMLANHYLQVARLLYQAGALDAAREFYEKIPNSTPDYMKAREELAWVLLRQGDTQKLRGELVTLASPVFDSRFAPEIHLVRAVSNLKLCFYSEVEKDFASFARVNSAWARKIGSALAIAETPAPETLDYFSRQAEDSLAKREAEVSRIDRLAQESIQVSLPAVGPQQHWVRLGARIRGVVDLAKKTRIQEYRRQWQNRKAVLAEAIRKMQFVKVELLSQVNTLSRPSLSDASSSETQDQISLSSAAPVRAPTLEKKQGQIDFPFDGVIWPDEMFKLRSLAQNRCLGRLVK